MQKSIRLLSYYEVSAKLAARIGAGLPDEILTRCNHDPSVRLCFREPRREDAGVRLRFGSATLTEAGPIPDFFRDDTERLGAWAGTLNVAIRAMDAILTNEQQALIALPGDPSITWFLLELSSGRLRRIEEPDRTWIERDGSVPELFAEVLIRVSGSAEAIAKIVTELCEDKKQRELDANQTFVD